MLKIKSIFFSVVLEQHGERLDAPHEEALRRAARDKRLYHVAAALGKTGCELTLAWRGVRIGRDGVPGSDRSGQAAVQ